MLILLVCVFCELLQGDGASAIYSIATVKCTLLEKSQDRFRIPCNIMYFYLMLHTIQMYFKKSKKPYDFLPTPTI